VYRVAEDPVAAIRGADVAIIATPTAGLRLAAGLVHHAAVRRPVVWVCKGFEQSSGKLPHQVVAEVLGATAPAAALSGPSFALEVARGLPTAVTLAAADAGFARDLARELHQRRLRLYFTDDLVGVEVGGAVKNVMAIATGISDGLGLGLNARAALITRGLAEVARLGVALGGRAETFMGLAGAGDLILTCTGDLSRNRRVGLALGRGERLDAILAGLGHVAEGVHTAREVDAIARARAIDMPITREVCAVLFDGRAPAEAVAQLLARDPKAE
jgi:glycerol-3-phosphate dehydrogenase (NAD(P)+)